MSVSRSLIKVAYVLLNAGYMIYESMGNLVERFKFGPLNVECVCVCIYYVGVFIYM